jgi:hypothetical protein
MRKIFSAPLLALALVGATCRAAPLTLRASPCSDIQQFVCDNVASNASQKISITTINGAAASTSGTVHNYNAKVSVSVDGVLYAGIASAVGGALAGRTVSYKYSGRNIARTDGKPGQVDLNQIVLGITGVNCGRGKVCFTGSGVHTDLSAGTLTVH